MTEPLPYGTPVRAYGFRNRKSGLLVFGIIMIILGAMSGCIAMLFPFSIAMSRNMRSATTTVTTTASGGTVMTTSIGPGGPAGPATAPIGPAVVPTGPTILIGIVPYAMLTIGLIWTGIGSIQARRWVRPIVMTFGTLWLAIGCLGMLSLVIMAPSMLRSMKASMPPSATPLPAAALTVGLLIGGSFSLVGYVLLPALFVWYYRSIDVIHTLQFYDPHPRWTDEIPLPVLGMSIASALTAVSVLASSAYLVAPVFGVMIAGPAAAPLLLVPIVVFGAASILIYRRRMLGWHLAVWGMLVSYASVLLTMARIDPAEFGRVMGLPPEQIEMVKDNPMMHPAVSIGMALVVTAAALLFAFSARKYFHRPSGEDLSPNSMPPP